VFVEAVAEPRIEVLAVYGRRRTGVTVGGDHEVPGHAPSPEVLFESDARIPPGTKPGQEVAVIRFSVLYPATEGGTVDHDYYRDSHVPLAAKTWSPASVEIDKQIDGPYVAAVHFVFDSLEAMRSALASEGTAAVGADVPNYTTITPVRQVSEIVSTFPPTRE
jgi:uncharacterized protein (TIGR02118 family)